MALSASEHSADGLLPFQWQHPPSFHCPISRQCMQDPVVLCDGHTYERKHIEKWLRRHNTSPVSGLTLPQKDIFPNHALRNAIEEYFQQVLSAHRRAILKTMAACSISGSCSDNPGLAWCVDALMQCSLLLNSHLSTECVLRKIMEEARTIIGAEVASVFLYDAAREELFSTVNSTGQELRIPVAGGIAGHVARTGEPSVIQDAYSDGRFDPSVDVKTGFRTRNVVCVPLKAGKGEILGVAQLINKVGGGRVVREAGCFKPEDMHFLQVFASQAAAAVASDGVVEKEVVRQEPLMRHCLSEDLAHASRSMQFSRNLPRELALAELTCEEEPRSSVASSPRGSTPPSCPGKGSAALKRRMLALNGPQALMEEALASWQFDALALAEATGNRPLSSLAVFLFQRLGLVEEFALDEDKVAAFFDEIEAGYDDGAAIPYHNRAHAASVLHLMHMLLQEGGILRALQGGGKGSRGLALMACLIAAAIHDYEHPGLTNEFLAKTSHERALQYNDLHVNEQHHVGAAFSILLQPETNFLSELPKEDFWRLRGLVIQLVIGTDSADGSRILSSFCELLETSGTDTAEGYMPTSEKDGVLLLQVAMKCADLGHLALDWDRHNQWVHRLEEEFFAQGDLEKQAGLPVSFLMDRCKPGVSASQVGFFKFVVLPLFDALVRAAPGAEPLRAGAVANLQRWTELQEEPGA